MVDAEVNGKLANASLGDEHLANRVAAVQLVVAIRNVVRRRHAQAHKMTVRASRARVAVHVRHRAARLRHATKWVRDVASRTLRCHLSWVGLKSGKSRREEPAAVAVFIVVMMAFGDGMVNLEWTCRCPGSLIAARDAIIGFRGNHGYGCVG